jgi:MerR family redox-sensitive transcriptional activator SoxR
MSEPLTIGELAARSGVATSALRYYEDRGLIRSERTGAAHRRYRRPVIRRIAFIVFAQRIGLTLEEIREELARLPDDRVPKRADWAKLSATWNARIDAGLHRLRLPVAGPLQTRESGRRAGQARARPRPLGRRPRTLTAGGSRLAKNGARTRPLGIRCRDGTDDGLAPVLVGTARPRRRWRDQCRPHPHDRAGTPHR